MFARSFTAWDLFLDPFWLIKVPMSLIVVGISAVAIYLECIERKYNYHGRGSMKQD
jgi:hypothetical protein